MSAEATATASEATPGGSAGDGSGGSVAAPGPDLAAQLEQTEQRRRALQSDLDKQKAQENGLLTRIAQMEGQLSKLSQLDPETIADQMSARFTQQQTLLEARTALKAEYALARPEVLNAKFDTPEAMKAAFEASHNAEDTYRKSVESDATARILAQLAEKGVAVEGFQPAPITPAPEGGALPDTTGPVTAVDATKMSFADFNSLSDDVVDNLKL